MIFGEILAAVWAFETLKPIAMLAEFSALNVARRAIHTTNLQQAVAVVKRNLHRSFRTLPRQPRLQRATGGARFSKADGLVR